MCSTALVFSVKSIWKYESLFTVLIPRQPVTAVSKPYRTVTSNRGMFNSFFSSQLMITLILSIFKSVQSHQQIYGHIININSREGIGNDNGEKVRTSYEPQLDNIHFIVKITKNELKLLKINKK